MTIIVSTIKVSRSWRGPAVALGSAVVTGAVLFLAYSLWSSAAEQASWPRAEAAMLAASERHPERTGIFEVEARKPPTHALDLTPFVDLNDRARVFRGLRRECDLIRSSEAWKRTEANGLNREASDSVEPAIRAARASLHKELVGREVVWPATVLLIGQDAVNVDYHGRAESGSPDSSCSVDAALRPDMSFTWQSNPSDQLELGQVIGLVHARGLAKGGTVEVQGIILAVEFEVRMGWITVHLGNAPVLMLRCF
jgi:hypothetical protein